MSDTLVLPERPSEYVHDDYNLVDSGYRWAFGLPSEGQLSSPTCGAMPFRKGTGLCSPNCIRGEDWVFMDNWCYDRAQFPSWIIFNDWSSWDGTKDVIRKAPNSEQLSNMYGNLCGLCAVWGSNYAIEDQAVSYYEAESVVRNGL